MLRNLIALFVALGLGFAGWSLWHQLDRPVHSVRVEGPLSTAEQAAIRRVVSDNLELGLLSLNMAELRERIHSLSWPRSVNVRRRWPDGLVIRVEKESVVAKWGDGGYLTSAGKIVKLADGPTGALPELAASLSRPRRAMEIYQMLQTRVDRAGFSIARLGENPLGEWRLTFQSGMTLALGNEALSQRLERFLLTYRLSLAPRYQEIDSVDARYDNGVAVRWKETGTDYALR
jgi:cell division protein FtsQ